MLRTTLLLMFTAIILTSFTEVKKPKFPKAYVYIPSGITDVNGQDISVDGFYMLSTEISNLDYREYLAYLKSNNESQALQKAAFIDDNWALVFGEDKNTPFVKVYSSHSGFDNFPAVNITHEAAVGYCEWLSKILTEQNEGFIIQARLPTEAEWVHAARGGVKDAIYPWGGYYLRNGKTGDYLANFRMLAESFVSKNKQTGQPFLVPIKETNKNFRKQDRFTASVGLFPENDYGLHEMSGNVAEMLATKGRFKGGSWDSYGYDIRIDVDSEYNGTMEASPYIGFRPVLTVVEAEAQ